MSDEVYLGDGVYASFDGFLICENFIGAKGFWLVNPP